MKKNIPYIIIYLVFIVVFNIVYFLFKPEETNASAWISYALIHIAYIAVVVTQFLDKKYEEVVLNLSSYLVSSIYFIVEFIVGIVFILINPEGYKLALSLQIIVLGLYLIILVANLITNRKITDSLDETNQDRNYVKGVSAVISAILTHEHDVQVMKKLGVLYDIVHGSQIKTNADAMIIEAEIENRIMALEKRIMTMGVEEQIMEINLLISLANKRNIIVRR